MKGMYLSVCDLKDQSSGVNKKINMQLATFQNNGIDMIVPDMWVKGFSYRLLDAFLGICSITPYLFSIRFKMLFKKSKMGDLNFIYIRKTAFDRTFIKTLQTIKSKNPDIKVLLEIPTYPYDKEFSSLISKIRHIKDRKSRDYLYNYIDRIITYSNDKSIFKIPTINLSNAVDTRKIRAKKVLDNKNVIHIIAVAIFNFWHGYDRFLYGLALYYKNGGHKNIVFHLVGSGSEVEKYKAIVKENSLNQHVIFHGEKFGNELDEIYDQCEIALDSMGRHRSEVYYNSTIKGKEYGAKGLPIISGVETEFDSDPYYRYYMRVNATEEPINIDLVIDFYNRVYNGWENKNEIIKNIREYTRNHFEFSASWKPVLDFIYDNSTEIYNPSKLDGDGN